MQGLAEVLLGVQPSVSVVSNGAECIMIDKDFYVKHASDKLIQRIRSDVSHGSAVPFYLTVPQLFEF